MCLLVESIKVMGRKVQNLSYHNRRMNDARKYLFGENDAVDLNTVITIPEDLSDEVYKCRVVYSKAKIEKIEFIPYVKRKIKSLKIIEDEGIDYTYKYINRDHLNRLFEQREECDDIIIVKGGYVTDAYSSNIALHTGKVWHTPSTPLLKGTKRQFLLETGKLHEEKVKKEDIGKYEKVSLINAMIDLEEICIYRDSIIF